MPDSPMEGVCWAAAWAIAPRKGRPALAPSAFGLAPNALGSRPI